MRGAPLRGASAQCPAVGANALHQRLQNGFGLLVGDLAGARRVVAATAVFEHQIADVGLAAAVEDGLAGGKHGVLLLHTPHHMDGDVGRGEQRVNHEAVDRPDGFFSAQVQHHQVAVLGGAAQDLLFGAGGVVKVERDALLHIGQGQDLRDGVVAAVFDEVHHQLVVADAEFAKAPQAGARVHQVVQQHPALGVEDVFARILGRVGLIDGGHHLVGDARKTRLATVVVVHHARRRGGMRLDDVVGTLAGVAHGFGLVVVKHQVRAGHVRQVGGDVALGDGDLAVLHVFGVDEQDVVDQLQLMEQHGAHQAIKVAAGHQSVGGLAHGVLLKGRVGVMKKQKCARAQNRSPGAR